MSDLQEFDMAGAIDIHHANRKIAMLTNALADALGRAEAAENRLAALLDNRWSVGESDGSWHVFSAGVSIAKGTTRDGAMDLAIAKTEAKP